MPTKKWREMDAWRVYISHKIVVSKELDAHLNLPKIQLISHWVEQIGRYGALQQYSAVRHEQVPNTNLQDGCNTSNHNLNYLPQVITFQCRILYFEIRELNPQHLAQCWLNSAVACQILPSGADLAAPRSPQSYAKPEFMGPQNRCDGKQPDAMIKHFIALLDNTQDAAHHVPIYHGTREFIKHKCHNTMYILDEKLHAMELSIYHDIMAQVGNLDGERISQMCQ